MPYSNSQALVLQRSDYRDNDRILTLFSPEQGRVDALCRGCRKPKSPLMPAAELFTLGDYVLFSGKGRRMIQSCSVIEGFYPLRLDYQRLLHAALMATACLRTIQEEQPAGHLFILLVRSLKRLAYEEQDPQAVTAAFLLHFVSLNGFLPQLDQCVGCQRSMAEEGGFLFSQEDGISCTACGAHGPKRSWLSANQLAWLRQVLTQGIDKAQPLAGSAPLEPLQAYAQDKLELKLPSV